MTYDKSTIASVPLPTHHRFIDLTARIFTRWTVQEYVGRDIHKKGTWQCLCQCGNVSNVTGQNLLRGISQSCGCLKAESTRRCFTVHGESVVNHVSREYEAYVGAKGRCQNSKDPQYRNYGGRGIEFRFLSFPEFLKYMGRKPTSKHSLDRYPNNNGHYEIGNVRWATQKEQMRNMRRNRRVTINGIRQCTSAWAEFYAISIQTIYSRLRYGWCETCAITIPVKTSSCPHVLTS